jgi:lipoprotein-anchoring transpeptidase ErfK/SrfK
MSKNRCAVVLPDPAGKGAFIYLAAILLISVLIVAIALLVWTLFPPPKTATDPALIQPASPAVLIPPQMTSPTAAPSLIPTATFTVSPTPTFLATSKTRSTETPSMRKITSTLPPAVSFVRSYTVAAGDNLYDLASHFGVTVLDMMMENHIANASILYPGQVLVIPGADGGSEGKFEGSKRIVVVLSDQKLYAFQGDQPIFEFVVSTGRAGGTITGTYTVLDKVSNAYSDLWDFWMPDWMGIYYVGEYLENGFHALPVLENGDTIWGDSLGTPVSYGCVVLSPKDADRLFNWAEIGTPVEIDE